MKNTDITIIVFILICCFITASCQMREEKYLSGSQITDTSIADVVTEDAVQGDVEIPKCNFTINQVAYERPGPTKDGILLIDGRLITPAGENITINTFPMNLVEVSDKGWLIVTNSGRTMDRKQYLQVVDIEKGEIIHKYQTEGDYGNFLGLYLSKDKRTIYASGGANDNLVVLKLNDDGSIEKRATIPLSGFIGHLILNADESKLYAAQHIADKIASISIGDGYKWETSIRVGLHSDELPYAYPFWLALSKDEKKLYVSNWGDMTLSVVDVGRNELIKNINVGKNPEGILLSPDGKYLYVANSDTDNISVIDTVEDRLLYNINLNNEGMPYGVSPTVMDISKDGKYLFVPEANSNAVSIIDTAKKEVIGRVPVGFYPVRALLSEDQKRLFVVNAKGNGSSPNPKGEDADELLYGSISVLELEDIFSKIKDYSAKVVSNNTRAMNYYDIPCENIDSPVPISKNYKSPIKHIIFIVKENKTFDQVLGDLEGVEAEPSLVRFGEMFTPNVHKLAKEFAVLDNCFAESEV